MTLETRKNPDGARTGRRSVSAAWKRTVTAAGGVLQILGESGCGGPLGRRFWC